MDAGRWIRLARRRAGLTQRELASRTGVHQPDIARIESGRVTPRVDTVDRLLCACGERLDAVPLPDDGVDRSQIRERLRWTVERRLEELVGGSAALGQLRRKRR